MSSIGVRQRGFTLVEVLVALSIMVILFALLFAPMIAGIEWVTSGRANVRMQDACRYAMEHIKRELGEAVYVHRLPGHNFDHGTPNNIYDDKYMVNYAQIVFHPPARDALGKVIYPPRPAVDASSGLQQVVRYAVRLVDPGAEYSDLNPFALYRQEFLWDPNQPNPLGSFDSGGNWQSGVPVVENALTPKRDITFEPTTTVFLEDAGGAPLDDPQWTAGYVPYDGSRELMYLFNGLRFEPQPVTGDIAQTQNGVVYKASRGAWDGTSLSGAFLANAALARSELDPELELYAWDPDADEYSILRLDSTNAAPRPVSLRWSSDAGAVTCGEQVNPAAGLTPPANVVFGGQTNGWWTVNTAGDITAFYPASTANPPMDAGNAPTQYVIDPSVHHGGPALIQPGTVRVQVVAKRQNEPEQVIDLRPTDNFEQRTISGNQYCVQLQRRDHDGDGQVDGNTAMIRLSRFDPPRPNSRALTGRGGPFDDYFWLRIYYYFRRNYTYDRDMDVSGQFPFVSDLVKADYKVRNIQNVSLTLTRYTDMVDDGSGALVVPSDERPNEVTVREQVVIRNFGR